MKQTPDGPHLQYLLRYGDSGLLTVMVKVAGQPFGPGTALAITGALIIGLAVVTARLMRAAHPPKRSEPGGESQHPRHIRQSQRSPAQKYCRHTETFPRPHRQALSLTKRLAQAPPTGRLPETPARCHVRALPIDVTVNVYTEVSDAKTLQTFKRLRRQLGS